MSSSVPKRQVPLSSSGERILEPRVGWVAAQTGDGRVRVDFPGNVAGPLVARVSLGLEPAVLVRAAAERHGAILLFENGDPSLPMLVGLVAPSSATPLIDAVLERSLEDVPKEARVDGRRVVIEGRDEVVLRCGKATLTLRRNGEVVLRGTNIRTEAEGIQRIKGGKVQIN